MQAVDGLDRLFSDLILAKEASVTFFELVQQHTGEVGPTKLTDRDRRWLIQA